MPSEGEILTNRLRMAGIRVMSFVRLGSTMINVERIAYTVYHDAVQPLQPVPGRFGLEDLSNPISPQKLVIHFTGGISTAFSGEEADHALRMIGGAMGMGEN
ncbi:MAG: hypothetical protein JWO82_3095 [Akkermansiaceae bacterium]|nr:hypothetical protein [Akkermansiaceae bacterium]